MKLVIWEYRFIIAIIIALGVVGLLEWEMAKSKLYALMLQAKRLAKDAVLNSGQEQEDWVTQKAYLILPQFVKVFISEELLRQLIKWLYEKAKDYLDDGELNNSI